MKKGRIYRAILVIPLFGGIAARLLRVVIAFFLRDMGLTVFEITILGSVFMLTRGIFSPVLGKLSDKGVSRFLIVVIGFLGLGIDSLLYLHASYPLMLLLRGFDGLYGAMVWPTIQTFVHFSSEQRIKSRLMSVYYVMGGLGGSIGYLLYNTMLGNIKYAIVTVSILYLLGILLSSPFRGLKEKEKPLNERTRRTSFYLYSLSLFYGMFFALGSEVILFYLAEIMGLGKEITTILLSVATIIALVGTLGVGYLSDKFSYRHAMWILAFLSFFAGLFLMINSIPLAIMGTILLFISGRSFLPISRSFAASTTKNVGTSIGLLNFTSNIGSVISPLIGGAMLDYFQNSKFFIFNLSALLFFLLTISILVNTYLLYGYKTVE